MFVFRDVREYHECVDEFHITAVDVLFDTFRHLVNVFAVPAESLQGFINDDPAFSAERISRDEIGAFIRLRADFKSARLARFL